MPSKSGLSKAFAAAFVVLTVSVICATVTMVILYQVQMKGINPTPRPTAPNTAEPPPPVLRLPRSLIPDHYDLVLQPQLYTRIIHEVNVTSPNQTLVFNGTSTVHFRCVQKTSSIFMHSRDLEVFGPVLNDTDTKKSMRSKVKVPDEESGFLELELDQNLEVGGNYSLRLDFRGQISQNLDALFLSEYQEKPTEGEDSGTDRCLAATNLQPTDARRLFPCFDEPDMKATFNVKIIHRRDTTALFNTKKTVSNLENEDWKYTCFETTPKMSTYLFAFTVSEFTSEASHTTGKRVTIRTFARPEATEAKHTSYASQITPKILEFYERRFGIDYQLGELDQIALPDLYPAAMENWGLVTYQEGLLLYEEGVSSLLHKEDVAGIIAHELAHQWFGNLVTMKWWNNVWLNEGFATYMSHFAVDAVEPMFRMKETSIMKNLHAAFEEDALASSHPLIPPRDDIHTSDEIIGLFDSISYNKGSLMLRMLADVVGESVFNEGINNYLEKFKFSNTDQNDLWSSIETVRRNQYGLSVEQLMTPWVSQSGFPVVTINTTNGEVFQKQFLYNNTAESRLSWNVPIWVMSYISEPSLVWLEATLETVAKEEFIAKDGEWILANVNSTGYYRVNYNLENWQLLLKVLETNRHLIPLMNRGQLIDDAFNLARAKLIDVTLALNSTLFLRNEREFLPWESAVTNLHYFVLMFDRSEVYGPMQEYLRNQVEGLYNFYRNYTNNSTVPEDHSEQHNQVNAIWMACSNGLPECVEMAKMKFAEWMQPNGTNNIHPNLRSVIYCQAVAAGGKAEWEFAWDQYLSSNVTSEKDQLREALSCTRKTWLLNRYLEYTLDLDKIRLMDVASTIDSIASNPAGQALAWNFIRAHWDYIKEGDTPFLIEGVTSRFSTQFELDELERFAADYDLGSADGAAQRALEQTRVNIEWVKDNKDVVLQWFEAQTAAGNKY
uniref:Aminopeptidase n=1 Tax=Acanthochromis polyacanthus TaxID=80966 RepID=A0A3Q1F5F9_9TELE